MIGLKKTNQSLLFFQYLGSLLIILFLSGCGGQEGNESSDKSDIAVERLGDVKDIAKIDIHTHYRFDRSYLIAELAALNMQTVLVDVVRTEEGKEIRSWDKYLEMKKQYPNRFYLCSGFNAYGIDDPNYAKETIERLGKEISEGARMVKVWKNFGMVHKDASGTFIQIDDARLQPIWDFLAGANIPVMAHIAEPLQAWIPIDTLNPHSSYFQNHPEYHAYQHPKIPHYDTIIAARDRWIANNPKLTIMGAHFGSMTHDVDEVAKRLDQFPNFMVEPGARFGDLVRQDSRKVAAFFNKYQDRILYGSDIVISNRENELSKDDIAQEKEFMHHVLNIHWKYLSSDESFVFDSPVLPRTYKTKGLNLSREVLQKVYHDNAAKLLNIKSH